MYLKTTLIVVIALILSGTVAATPAPFSSSRVQQQERMNEKIKLVPAVVTYCGFVNRHHQAMHLRAIDSFRPEAGCPRIAPTMSSSAGITT